MLQKLQNLCNRPGTRVLFTGIGNVLRSDDGAGVYICRKLKASSSCEVLVAEVSIENYIGRINRSGADVLVLVDCVDFGRDPGYYDLLPVKELQDMTFHTHNISLKKISELFRMPAWILGIQPASTSFGEELSVPVRKAAGAIIRMINDLCRHAAAGTA
jgi:hydrogenase maturation protease